MSGDDADADADADAFDPKGNQGTVIDAPSGTYKVEAVAGSGKTTTMVERIREDIHAREIPPNRILVLTFATEAAHTIQEKLRERLGPHDAFEVDVYNYHSFCYQLLRDHAYYLGLSPDFELITEERRPQLIESVYEEVDFSFVDFGDPGSDDDETLSDLTSFIEKMRREGVTPDDVRDFLPSDEAIRELLSLVSDLRGMARELVNVDANGIMWEDGEIAKGCEQAARVYRAKSREFADGDGVGSEVPEVSAFLRSMADLAENVAEHLRTSTSTDLDWWDYRLADVLLEDQRFRRGDPKQTPMGRLSEYAHMLRRARAFVDAYEAYLSVLETRGALDYDELIHRAVRLLRDDEVRDTVLSRWDAVYCDEFQDTDESQLELVDELRDELDIMVIGDSDQAIHEWRGQDPENMSNLPAEFEEESIELNFRSRQPVLDLTNYLDRETTEIRAHKGPSPPNVFKINSEGQVTEEQVETTISNLLSGRFDDVGERDLSDVAVLVRQNYQARAIARQLEAEGIPYSLSKDAADELGHGLRTVLSYLRILVDPGDDVSWQRVLLHLYRVPESDVDTLLEAGDTVPDGYDAVSDGALSRPGRLDDALSDYRTLRDLAATHSISELYLHLKEETRVDWFLRQSDRDAIRNIDRLISSFDDSPVQSRLTGEFVAYLERQAQMLVGDDETATSQGTESSEAVDVMTVHQAKGLDFDTVLLPYLTEDAFANITLSDYQHKIYNYDVLVDGVAGEIDDPLRADLSDDQIAEEWRILHVAITRAEERLFLFGHSAPSEEPPTADVDRHLPGAESEAPIRWSTGGPRMRVWDALTDSYDRIAEENGDAVRDYTEIVNREIDSDPGTITYYVDETSSEEELSTDEALELTLEFVDEVVAGTLATGDADTSDFADAPLGKEVEVSLSRQHSHSALEAVRDCERRHVLNYVVDAFPDPVGESRSLGSGDRADVGTLFHDVAELAYWRNYETAEEWTAACRRVAERDDLTHALDDALACIDRYFETAASVWEPVGAEVPFELERFADVDGAVTGYIDTIRDCPDGGLAVLDYKTSRERKTLDESHQLLLYLLACRERFDVPVTHAGYVYVGQAGPETQLFDADELEARLDSLREDLLAADASSFGTADPGSHCQYCPHRSLGCAPDEHDVDNQFRADGDGASADDAE